MVPGSSATRAVLWDLDGTLVDSSAYHWRAWQLVLEAEAVHITESDFHATFGQRNDEILRVWLGPDADWHRIRQVGERKEEHYRDLLAAGGVEPLPGAREWVGALHAAGWRQAIASSAPRLNVEAMRSGLPFTHVMAAVVGAEDVRAGKPDPEVFLVAAERVGAGPGRCVVVEDAAAGIEAARRAGMRTIGVGRGALENADIVVRSLTELAPDAFDRLLGTPPDADAAAQPGA
jgi:HAD superfamily hydrolase (TIGR01509 family)